MNIKKWARQVLCEQPENMKQLQQAQRELGGVYIALITESDINGFNLEVETEPDAAVLAMAELSNMPVEKAREQADAVEQVLKEHNIHVYDDRSEWERQVGREMD